MLQTSGQPMEVHRCCATDPVIKSELQEDLKKQLTDLPIEESFEENGKMLRALSHPLRLKMAFLLLKRDHCVCELVELTKRKRNLVSHHLAVMRKSELIKPYMKSDWKYYKLNETTARVMNGIEWASVKTASNPS